jgi:hypothetical protein
VTAVITQLEQSAIEVENPAGSRTVVAGAFDYANQQPLPMVHIAAGARQRFDKFSRLALVAPEGAPSVLVVNPSPLLLDVYRETKTERFLLCTVGVGQQVTVPIAREEQLFIVPRADPYIPPPPRIVEARYNRGNPLTDDDNFVSLRWSYPPDHLARIGGYNVLRAVYHGAQPVSIQKLNAVPQREAHANIQDFGVHGKENHRYAVTAVGLNGVESLFSNVLILDKSSLWGMTDAGMIPL